MLVSLICYHHTTKGPFPKVSLIQPGFQQQQKSQGILKGKNTVWRDRENIRTRFRDSRMLKWSDWEFQINYDYHTKGAHGKSRPHVRTDRQCEQRDGHSYEDEKKMLEIKNPVTETKGVCLPSRHVTWRILQIEHRSSGAGWLPNNNVCSIYCGG